MNSTVPSTTVDSIIASMVNARRGIQSIGQPILFALGSIGCLLNILIFLRHSMRSNSCAIYFHGSSWANLSTLTWGMLVVILNTFGISSSLGYNTVYCKIRYFIFTSSQLSARACVVLACLDRFLLCSQSVRQRSFCRSSVAIKLLLSAISFCVCISIYLLIVYETNFTTHVCTTSTSEGKILDTTILFVFNFGIPTILMSTLTGLLLWRLKQNSRRISRQRVQVHRKDSQLAAMLIGQVLLYIITALPFVANMAYGTATQYVPQSSKSAYRIAAEGLFTAVTASFGGYLFNALSFYVYTLTAPIFRRELIALIVPRRWRANFVRIGQQQITMANRINPSNQTNQVTHFRTKSQ